MARNGLHANRKFPRLAQALNAVSSGMGEIMARGVLETLWSAAYERADDHLGDADDVEIAAKWRGERGALVAALIGAGGPGAAGFIEMDPERGGYRIHDLWDHAPPHVKRKAEAEAARRAAGKTLADVRREAGRKGAAARVQDGAQQTSEDLPATGKQTVAIGSAKVSPGLGRDGMGREGVGTGVPPPGARVHAREAGQGEPAAAPGSRRDLVAHCAALVGTAQRTATLAPAADLVVTVADMAEQAARDFGLDPKEAADRIVVAYDAVRAGCTAGKVPGWRGDKLRDHADRIARIVAGTESPPPPWQAPSATPRPIGGKRQTGMAEVPDWDGFKTGLMK